MGTPDINHPFFGEWVFGLFCLLACYEQAAVNIDVQVFAWICISISLVNVSRSGISGSYRDSA